jgi:hypothetical protein
MLMHDHWFAYQTRVSLSLDLNEKTIEIEVNDNLFGIIYALYYLKRGIHRIAKGLNIANLRASSS